MIAVAFGEDVAVANELVDAVESMFDLIGVYDGVVDEDAAAAAVVCFDLYLDYVTFV